MIKLKIGKLVEKISRWKKWSKNGNKIVEISIPVKKFGINKTINWKIIAQNFSRNISEKIGVVEWKNSGLENWCEKL